MSESKTLLIELKETLKQFVDLQQRTHALCAKISQLQQTDCIKSIADMSDLGGFLRTYKDSLKELRKEVEARYNKVGRLNGEYLAGRSLQEGAEIKGIGSSFKSEFKYECAAILPKKETEEWDELIGELGIIVPEDKCDMVSLSYNRIKELSVSKRASGEPLKNVKLVDQFSTTYRKR